MGSLEEVIQARSIPEPNSGCWLWTGRIQTDSRYGTMYIDNRRYYAHRLSWEAHNGRPIPDGLFVCHHCDTPPCVNPSHLFIGTKRDNALDRERKGRGNQPVGERNGKSRLTLSDVELILSSNLPHETLARRLGVSGGAVRSVRRGDTWRHVTAVAEKEAAVAASVAREVA